MRTAFLLCVVATTGLAAESPLTCLTFTPDGKSCVATSQAGLQIFSWPSLRRRQIIKTGSHNLHCARFSPDGKRLAVAGGEPADQGIVEVFAWPDKKRLQVYRSHGDSVMTVDWQNNEKFFSASLDRKIHQCDVTNRGSKHPVAGPAPTLSFLGHSRGVLGLCYIDSKKSLISAGSDQSLRVWSVENGKLIRSLNQHTASVTCIALRPSNDGLPMVASGSEDHTIRFWQPTIGRFVKFVRLPATPLSLAWTRDGQRAVAGCDDGHVRVIDPVEVKIVSDLDAVKGWAYALAIHPSEDALVVGGTGGQIRRLPLGDER